MEFLTNHWAEIALAIITAAGTLTALTETKRDDRIVNILSRILQAIVFGKNRKK
jgi:C4-dicarboxylate transporter